MTADADALMAYIQVLERTITLAADEMRLGGDPGYAARILWTMENRILAAAEAAERETAERRTTLH
jgi:hypothetical protein